MRNLTVIGGSDYLGRILPEIYGRGNFKVVSFEEVTEETYVNYIFRAVVLINRNKKVLYLRQTRDHVKTRPEKGLEENRIQYEAKILELLGSINRGIVPEVLYLDRKNNIAILSDIKKGAPLLVKELIAGRAHPETARYFGQILATFHSMTCGIGHGLVRGSLRENRDAIAFHLGMRLDPAQKLFPQEVRLLLSESKRSMKTLVMGDLASKNIFVQDKKVRFLDLERSFIGDPAFDLAFLFCHYLIEVAPSSLPSSIEFIRQFMKSYRLLMRKRFTLEQLDKLENRVVRFLGVTILYRLFGFYLVIKVNRRSDKWKKVAEFLLKSSGTNLVSALEGGLEGNRTPA